MTNTITTLTCPSCGSRLQLIKGVDRFACFYCGNEHIVHRESGIVYLEPIAEDVRHIRAGVDNIRGGVDKTAAELAIVRLTKELNDLENKLKSSIACDLNKWIPRSDLGQALLFFSVVLFLVAASAHVLITWLIFLCFFCPFVYLEMRRNQIARALKDETIHDIQVEITQTKASLIKNRKLV